ncbi:MAG: right-handed parallel beta-helix repeat-containing protein [Candidatus Andeanibacterium colombiense]|uniref:Right-handed parallel beta-helix repeat-containing protein n=1 Tax=Candidatus Andeanibacterium colombiense TaxID=3121345 RepID=A0AAJ5X4B4_9SPHN|nr:MAG: right-handed parallel beta-helix repeat-containing protein [Sphingomonadaceae bacterium]
MNTRIRILLAMPWLACTVAAIATSDGPLSAQAGAPPYKIVETGRFYGSLQQAVDAIGSGKGSIAVSPGLHSDCAVQSAGDVTYLAAEPGKAVFDGVTCEGKAALVLRGRSASVSGLVFQNMQVPDFNGAGIRLEHGDLTVAQSWFRDSQEGILSAEDPNGRIVIDKSTFTRLGTCEGGGGCAHSVYIGGYGQLRVTRSRFEQGRGGHYVKARAARVNIASSSFDDTGGRGTNYMIDLPAGSTGQITNNWFVQGTNKENYSALIAVGAEERRHSSDGLQIAGNDARLAPKANPTTFVADWTGDKLAVGENKLGQGIKRFEKR